MKRILTLTLLLATVFALTLSLSACGKNKVGDVDPASITYDGDTISWNSAKNASKYTVKINGSEFTTYNSSLAYRADAENVTVEITPISSKDKEGDTVARSFKKLDEVENLYFDEDGNLTWDAVPGATAYLVEVNGKSSEKLTSCSYSTFVEGKVNKIRVRATSTDNSTFSYWGEMVSKTYLAPPTNIKFDGSKIQWNGSSQAKGYDLYVNGSKVNDDPVNGSYYLYEANGESFDLTIKSIGNGESVFSSRESDPQRYVSLGLATNFVVTDGALKWDPVEDATSYAVSVNGVEKTVTEPIYSNIIAGRDNIIKVKPLGNTKEKDVTYFSEWSSEQNIHILAAPLTSWNSSMNLDGLAMNAFQWEISTGSISGYEVLLVYPDGTNDSFPVSKDRDNFGFDFIESGNYKISVKAVADAGTGVYDSAYSDPITVIRLAPPTPNNSAFIESSKTDLTAGFTANFIDDKKASGYSIYKEGALIITKNRGDSAPNSIKITDIVNSNMTTRQEITYSAQAIGLGKETVSGGDRIVTLSSLSSKNYSFTITVLAAPEDLSISGTILTWGSVQGANGYKVSGIGNGSEEAVESFNFTKLKITPADYSVQVCAKGNGSDVLPSPFSAAVRVRKLAAPSDIHVVTTGESEGKLEFQSVAGATSYAVYFNGNEEPVNANNVNNIHDYVISEGVYLSVVAIADSFDDANQIYCLTSEKSSSISLTRLSTPTWPETYHNETHLIWNGPTNVNAATPGYLVYTGSSLAHPGAYNSNEFDLTSFEPGTYTFYVKAVGDGRTTINSQMSDPKTIVKLAKPDVKLNIAEGKYYWYVVEDAQRYVVRINGEIVETIPGETGTLFSYTPVGVFKNGGTYKVSVTAVNDEYVDSNPAVIEQEVKQITSPTFNVSYSSDSYKPGEKIIVNATHTDPNATGFVFEVGGSTSNVEVSGTYEFAVNATGAYTVRVVSTGGAFDANSIYYINSPHATAQSITILGTVGMSSVKLNTQGKLSWNTVDGAVMGYEIVVDFGNGVVKTYTASADNPSISLAADGFDMSLAPTYKFKIRALGNESGTLIASAWIEWDMSKQ